VGGGGGEDQELLSFIYLGYKSKRMAIKILTHEMQELRWYACEERCKLFSRLM
jgi:hypothetical protein